MTTYRMALPASICISVQAETEQEAVALARRAAEEFDSIQLRAYDLSLDPVVYTENHGEPSIEDIED